MRRVLRQRNFLLFFGSTTVSLLGDWALLLALPFYVYEQTESIASTGALVAAELLPRLLLSSAAGVLVDRWDRRWTMAAADLFRAGLLLSLLLLSFGAPLWMIYVVAFLEACAAQLFLPAEGALLPRIVKDERELLAANSLISAGVAATKLIGPPLGGLLYAVLGLSLSAVLDSVSFALSAVAILAIRPLPAAAAEDGALEAIPEPKQSFVSELREGVQCILANRVFGVLCWTIAIVMVAQGIVQTTLVPFVRSVLGFDTVEFGILASAEGLGALLGALGIGLISRYLTGGKVLAAVLILASVFMFGFTLARPIALSAALLFLASIPAVIAAVWVQTYYQQHVDNRMLGRVLGVTDNLSALGMLIGIIGASLLDGLLGTATIMMLAGVVLLLGGITALVFLRGVSASLTAAEVDAPGEPPDPTSLALSGELKGVGL